MGHLLRNLIRLYSGISRGISEMLTVQLITSTTPGPWLTSATHLVTEGASSLLQFAYHANGHIYSKKISSNVPKFAKSEGTRAPVCSI